MIIEQWIAIIIACVMGVMLWLAQKVIKMDGEIQKLLEAQK